MIRIKKYEDLVYKILLVLYSFSVVFHTLNTGDTTRGSNSENWSELGHLSEIIMWTLFMLIIGLLFTSLLVWLIYSIYKLKYKNIIYIFFYILFASLLSAFWIIGATANDGLPDYNFHMLLLMSIVIINIFLRYILFKVIE
jgi:hypothetical protein